MWAASVNGNYAFAIDYLWVPPELPVLYASDHAIIRLLQVSADASKDRDERV